MKIFAAPILFVCKHAAPIKSEDKVLRKRLNKRNEIRTKKKNHENARYLTLFQKKKNVQIPLA